MKTKKKQPTPKRKTAKPDLWDRIAMSITGCSREEHMHGEFLSSHESRRIAAKIRRAVKAQLRIKPKPSPKAKPKAVADEPMVTGPHQLGGMWDIRTSSHYWHPNRAIWMRRDDTRDTMGLCVTEAIARRALPAARKAWAEMKSGGAQ